MPNTPPDRTLTNGVWSDEIARLFATNRGVHEERGTVNDLISYDTVGATIDAVMDLTPLPPYQKAGLLHIVADKIMIEAVASPRGHSHCRDL